MKATKTSKLPKEVRTAVMRAKSEALSDLFTAYVHQRLGVECVREYRFHPVRKWRFDYAIPLLKIAIECDGGVFTRGRHVRPVGYLNDMEKFNASSELGWLVLKFTPQQLMKEETIATIRTTIDRRMREAASMAKANEKL